MQVEKPTLSPAGSAFLVGEMSGSGNTDAELKLGTPEPTTQIQEHWQFFVFCLSAISLLMLSPMKPETRPNP